MKRFYSVALMAALTASSVSAYDFSSYNSPYSGSDYREALNMGLKFFGGQRCGKTNNWMLKNNPDVLKKFCHAKDGQGKENDGANGSYDLTGGWHDCGDHIKVATTMGYAAISLLVAYGLLLGSLKFLGKTGLYACIAICTILANIEVTILVVAFGMEQTLGNTLFAATFLATDILSELYGKEDSKKGAFVGIMATVTFMFFSFIWQRYIPSENDWAMPQVKALFGNTPRMLLASLIAYAVSEILDVNLYHWIWSLTEKKTGDKIPNCHTKHNTISSIKTYKKMNFLNIFSNFLVVCTQKCCDNRMLHKVGYKNQHPNF